MVLDGWDYRDLASAASIEGRRSLRSQRSAEDRLNLIPPDLP